MTVVSKVWYSSAVEARSHQRHRERAIVLQLLRDDHDEWWTRGQLRAELEMSEDALDQSLRELEQHSVVVMGDTDRVVASPCARHLDALELIGV